MSPKKLRVMVCDTNGQCFMSDGIPLNMCDIHQPVYDSLGTEPLLVPNYEQQAPPCCCEYIVIREGSPDATASKPMNVAFRKISGAFFVLKYVTNSITMNRIQIEVAQHDRAAIVSALCAKYA